MAQRMAGTAEGKSSAHIASLNAKKDKNNKKWWIAQMSMKDHYYTPEEHAALCSSFASYETNGGAGATRGMVVVVALPRVLRTPLVPFRPFMLEWWLLWLLSKVLRMARTTVKRSRIQAIQRMILLIMSGMKMIIQNHIQFQIVRTTIRKPFLCTLRLKLCSQLLVKCHQKCQKTKAGCKWEPYREGGVYSDFGFSHVCGIISGWKGSRILSECDHREYAVHV
jgi:hypothetical protein